LSTRTDASLALLSLLAAGCYTEQAIELSVHRTDPSFQLAVKVCRADQVATDEHCTPSGHNQGFVFPDGATATTTSVHVVIEDESSQVLLKMFDGTRTQCGVVTVGDELVRYDVTVTASSLDWVCDGACLPSAGCTY